jgi:phosphatidylglycerophosphate synthase
MGPSRENDMSQSMPNENECKPDVSDKLYHKSANFRDIFFRPLVVGLGALKITPNGLTFFGIAVMLLYVFLMHYSNTRMAALCLISSVVLDSLDGVLARYLKMSSDRGKFLDVMADNFNSFLFVLGLATTHLVNPLIMIAYVYFMLLGKTYKVYLNSFNYQSDWLFRAVAGFFTNFINYFSYALFVFSILESIDLNSFFLIMTVALAGYCLWHFILITNKKPLSKMQ